jgi:hypothetical protein
MSKTGWSQIAKDFAKPAMTDEEAAAADVGRAAGDEIREAALEKETDNG